MQQKSFSGANRDYSRYFKGVYVYVNTGDIRFLPKEVPLYSNIVPDDKNELRKKRLDDLAKRTNKLISDGTCSRQILRSVLKDLEFFLGDF